MAPQRHPVVAPIFVPCGIHGASAVPDFNQETGWRRQVATEHPVVVMGAETVCNPHPGIVSSIKGEPDVVAVSCLEHHVVQRLGKINGHPRERKGVVPSVAMEEPHNEW